MGGAHVRVETARSLEEERVEVRFAVCADARNTAAVIGRFAAEVTLDEDQMVRMVVRADEDAAT